MFCNRCGNPLNGESCRICMQPEQKKNEVYHSKLPTDRVQLHRYVLLAGGLAFMGTLGLCGVLLLNQVKQGAGKARVEAERKVTEQRQNVLEDDLRSSIENDKKFNVCKIRSTQMREDKVRNDQQLDLAGHTLNDVVRIRGCGKAGNFLYRSMPNNPVIEMLSQRGYACRLSSGNFANSTLWLPIRRDSTVWGTILNVEDANRGSMLYRVESENHIPHTLKELSVMMACRNFDQVDEVATITNGYRAEFSWEWKLTEFGQYAKLDSSVKHGRAYFQKHGESYALDQLDFGVKE